MTSHGSGNSTWSSQKMIFHTFTIDNKTQFTAKFISKQWNEVIRPFIKGHVGFLLTEIQKLLDGERRWGIAGVVLDFRVGIFEQRQKEPHFESLTMMLSGCDVRGWLRTNESISPPVTAAVLFSLCPHFHPPTRVRKGAMRWGPYGYETRHERFQFSFLDLHLWMFRSAPWR